MNQRRPVPSTSRGIGLRTTAPMGVQLHASRETTGEASSSERGRRASGARLGWRSRVPRAAPREQLPGQSTSATRAIVIVDTRAGHEARDVPRGPPTPTRGRSRGRTSSAGPSRPRRPSSGIASGGKVARLRSGDVESRLALSQSRARAGAWQQTREDVDEDKPSSKNVTECFVHCCEQGNFRPLKDRPHFPPGTGKA